MVAEKYEKIKIESLSLLFLIKNEFCNVKLELEI